MTELSMTELEEEEQRRFIQIMPAVGIWAVFDSGPGKSLWRQRVHGWGLQKNGSILPLIPEYPEGFMWNADEEQGFVCLVGDEDFAEHETHRLEDIPFVAENLKFRREREKRRLSEVGT